MNISIKEKIFSLIRSHKQGWAFSASDFLADFNRREIDESLSTLAKDGDIRRVTRGIYDLPQYSSTLKRFVAPEMNQVAHAFARKFNWKICPDGETALNYLGLSTQIPGKLLYLSNGPSKKYIINTTSLEFKRTALKEIDMKNTNAVLVIQAIKALGEAHITPDKIEILSSKFTAKEWEKILEDSSRASAWIQCILKKAYILTTNHNGS